MFPDISQPLYAHRANPIESLLDEARRLMINDLTVQAVANGKDVYFATEPEDFSAIDLFADHTIVGYTTKGVLVRHDEEDGLTLETYGQYPTDLLYRVYGRMKAGETMQAVEPF